MQDEMLDKMLYVLNIHGLNYANVESLENETNLKEELDFDSLDLVEYFMGLEEEFNIDDIDDNLEFITIGDIRKYIEDNLWVS